MNVIVQAKKRSKIKEAVAALKKAGRTKVRPTSLALLREDRREMQRATEMEAVVHRHLQTEVTDHVEECETTARFLETRQLGEGGGATEMSHDEVGGAIGGSCDYCDDDDVTFFVPFKKGSRMVCPAGTACSGSIDTRQTSFCPVSSSYVTTPSQVITLSPSIKTTPRASVQPFPPYTNAALNHTPSGSSCSLEATMGLPGCPNDF